jgi:hypothetical protein
VDVSGGGVAAVVVIGAPPGSGWLSTGVTEVVLGGAEVAVAVEGSWVVSEVTCTTAGGLGVTVVGSTVAVGCGGVAAAVSFAWVWSERAVAARDLPWGWRGPRWVAVAIVAGVLPVVEGWGVERTTSGV